MGLAGAWERASPMPSGAKCDASREVGLRPGSGSCGARRLLTKRNLLGVPARRQAKQKHRSHRPKRDFY